MYFFFFFLSFFEKVLVNVLRQTFGLISLKKKKTFGLIKYVDFKFDVDKH